MSQSSGKKSEGKKQAPEKKIIFSARFVKENFGDRHIVGAKESFVKTWTFRNNGETVWPEGSLFIQTNGDDLQASSVFIL